MKRNFCLSITLLITVLISGAEFCYGEGYGGGTYQQRLKQQKAQEEAMKQQLETRQRNKNEEMKEMNKALMIQGANQQFNKMQLEEDQKLQRAKNAVQKAETKKRIGFGTIKIKVEDYKKSKVYNMEMELGIKGKEREHGFGCWSENGTDLNILGKGNISGLMQEIKLTIQNFDNKNKRNEVLKVTASKGTFNASFEIKSNGFRRVGDGVNGELSIYYATPNSDNTAKIRSGGIIKYEGCAKNKGPSSVGGMDSGGYGGGGQSYGY